jgi:hypothetical protein
MHSSRPPPRPCTLSLSLSLSLLLLSLCLLGPWVSSDCSGHPFKSDCATDEFHRTLSQAAGVYVNMTSAAESATLHPLLSQTVAMTFSNFGFVNHLHNFLCHTDRFGYKVVVISLDDAVHEFLSNMTSRRGRVFSYLWDGGQMTKGASSLFFSVFLPLSLSLFSLPLSLLSPSQLPLSPSLSF